MFIDSAEIRVKGGRRRQRLRRLPAREVRSARRTLRRRRRQRRLGLGARRPVLQHALPSPPPDRLPRGARRARAGLQPARRLGEDVTVPFPLGSVVTDADTGERLADLVQSGRARAARRRRQRRLGQPALRDARRGRRRASRSKGQAGQRAAPRDRAEAPRRRGDRRLSRTPGKSTLISAISAAKPKIADYPFTTLVPHLGVVARGRATETLVVADIPGLIEGAHRGAGLGLRFLKHVERCRLLCHLVDASAEGDAESDVAVLETELAAFSPEVAARPRVLVASKCDAVSDPERRASDPAARPPRRGLPYFEISAVTHARLGGARRLLLPTPWRRRGARPDGADESWRMTPRRTQNRCASASSAARSTRSTSGICAPVEAAAREVRLRRVVFVPARRLALQDERPRRSPTPRRDARPRSRRAARTGRSRFDELDREPPSYTVDTLRALRPAAPRRRAVAAHGHRRARGLRPLEGAGGDRPARPRRRLPSRAVRRAGLRVPEVARPRQSAGGFRRRIG